MRAAADTMQMPRRLDQALVILLFHGMILESNAAAVRACGCARGPHLVPGLQEAALPLAARRARAGAAARQPALRCAAPAGAGPRARSPATPASPASSAAAAGLPWCSTKPTSRPNSSSSQVVFKRCVSALKPGSSGSCEGISVPCGTQMTPSNVMPGSVAGPHGDTAADTSGALLRRPWKANRLLDFVWLHLQHRERRRKTFRAGQRMRQRRVQRIRGGGGRPAQQRACRQQGAAQGPARARARRAPGGAGQRRQAHHQRGRVAVGQRRLHQGYGKDTPLSVLLMGCANAPWTCYVTPRYALCCMTSLAKCTRARAMQKELYQAHAPHGPF